MRGILIFALFISIISYSTGKGNGSFVFSGITENKTEYILFDEDTIKINKGVFLDTIAVENGGYVYIQLNTWERPRLIYVEENRSLNIDFSHSKIIVNNDPLNSYLLNVDSILIPYTLRWDMEEEQFRTTMDSELEINFEKIDSLFSEASITVTLINELKQIEKLKVAHRTANFISFQERKGKSINRNIYDFINDVDLNNPRLEKQHNNRNFQYYYLLDKVSEEVPDSIYPFAVIDTVNKLSSIKSIRKMIISSVVKSSFYDETVNHNRIMTSYEENFGKLEDNDPLRKLQRQIQKLKPGNIGPSIGELENLDGNTIRIEDLKGKNILISVWGTWCPYCKEELPYLKKLIDKYGDKFTSVGISFDKDRPKWKTYINENNWKGIHLIDSERGSTFKSNYLIGGTNVHYLIDKNGVIISNNSFKPSSTELEKLIEALN